MQAYIIARSFFHRFHVCLPIKLCRFRLVRHIIDSFLLELDVVLSEERKNVRIRRGGL